jgi:hypothetical protein
VHRLWIDVDVAKTVALPLPAPEVMEDADQASTVMRAGAGVIGEDAAPAPEARAVNDPQEGSRHGQRVGKPLSPKPQALVVRGVHGSTRCHASPVHSATRSASKPSEPTRVNR